jgi:hypothetical protein
MFRTRGARARIGLASAAVAVVALATGPASASNNDFDDLCRVVGNGAAVFNDDTGFWMYTIPATHDMRVGTAEHYKLNDGSVQTVFYGHGLIDSRDGHAFRDSNFEAGSCDWLH